MQHTGTLRLERRTLNWIRLRRSISLFPHRICPKTASHFSLARSFGSVRCAKASGDAAMPIDFLDMLMIDAERQREVEFIEQLRKVRKNLRKLAKTNPAL